jgi:molecular chaperone GrpE
MQDMLGRHGLQHIPAKGESFDPNVHEAVAVVNTDEHPHGRVIEEFQKGYRLGDLVLRPSKVVVNTGSSSSDTDETEAENED